MSYTQRITKKTYVGANYKHNKVNSTIEIKINDIPLHINKDKIISIEEERLLLPCYSELYEWINDNIDNIENGNVTQLEPSFISDLLMEHEVNDSLGFNDLSKNENSLFISDLKTLLTEMETADSSVSYYYSVI